MFIKKKILNLVQYDKTVCFVSGRKWTWRERTEMKHKTLQFLDSVMKSEDKKSMQMRDPFKCYISLMIMLDKVNLHIVKLYSPAATTISSFLHAHCLASLDTQWCFTGYLSLRGLHTPPT